MKYFFCRELIEIPSNILFDNQGGIPTRTLANLFRCTSKLMDFSGMIIGIKFQNECQWRFFCMWIEIILYAFVILFLFFSLLYRIIIVILESFYLSMFTIYIPKFVKTHSTWYFALRFTKFQKDLECQNCFANISDDMFTKIVLLFK